MESFGAEGHRERLRKKYRERGLVALQDYEVLELLLTYALPRRDTKVIAKKLLDRFGNLSQVLKADFASLEAISGIKEGASTFLSLVGAVSGIVFQESLEGEAELQIRRKEDLLRYLREKIAYSDQEIFMVLFLSSSNTLLASEELFRGSLDRSAIYPREILKKVIEYQAKSVIFAHNHPSGNMKASSQDIALTRDMKKALEMFDVLLLEHIIIGKHSYFSFLEEGLL